MNKPDVVIAGDTVFAGINEDDVSDMEKHSIVIRFDDKKQFLDALRTGQVNFTVFGIEARNDLQSN